MGLTDSALVIAGLMIVAIAVSGGMVLWLSRRPVRETPVRVVDPGTLSPRQLDSLIPDSRFIDIDGAQIHYVQAGEGRDVVLLHGIGASIFIWRFLFPLLQSKHRVTALDLPGFGQSCKEATRDYGLDAQTKIVSRVIEELKLDRPLLVGSSMGGAISLWLAKSLPARFPRIVVLSPAIDRSLVPAHFKHFALAAPILRRALNRRTMKLLISRVVSRHERITDDVVSAYMQPFLDKGESVRAFWSATTLLADKRLPQALDGLSARTLVIYGDRDYLVPRRSIEKLMRLLPHATLLTHAGGGHHIMEDEPEWLASAIEKFLASPEFS